MQRYLMAFKEHTDRALAQGFKAMTFPRFVGLVVQIELEDEEKNSA